MSQEPTNSPPTDARLDALLDEALSPGSIPGGVSAGLNDRIFAATRASLAASRARPPVLARLGAFHRVAIAAAVLLLVGGALRLGVRDAGGPAPTGPVAAAPDLSEAIAAVALAGPHEPIDRELDLLAAQIEQIADATRWGASADRLGETFDELEFHADEWVF